MLKPSRIKGYTLIEVVVAVIIFTVGALSLAASSALVARAMARNTVRERAARIAVSRIEALKSQCATATSGKETFQEIESDWAVTHEASRLSIVESVRCPMSPGLCGASYRAMAWCRP
jgi:prepilin-type N-terminal cleavage/methylation domain-containing protein